MPSDKSIAPYLSPPQKFLATYLPTFKGLLVLYAAAELKILWRPFAVSAAFMSERKPEIPVWPTLRPQSGTRDGFT